MTADGERNFLPIVAIIIALVFAGALASGWVVYQKQLHREAPVAAVETVSLPPAPSAIPTATPIFADPTSAPIDTNSPPVELSTRAPWAHGTASATIGPSEVTGADRVIARMRSSFKYCYNRALVDDPTLSGSITLSLKVAPNGDVTDVTKTGTISPSVDACLVGRAKIAKFDPTPSGRTVNVPLHFVHAP